VLPPYLQLDLLIATLFSGQPLVNPNYISLVTVLVYLTKVFLLGSSGVIMHIHINANFHQMLALYS